MFDGSFRAQPRINLGGRSSAPISAADAKRQAFLERQRRERDRVERVASHRIVAWSRARIALLRFRAGQRAAVATALAQQPNTPPNEWLAMARTIAVIFDTHKGDAELLGEIVTRAPPNADVLVARVPELAHRFSLAVTRALPTPLAVAAAAAALTLTGAIAALIPLATFGPLHAAALAEYLTTSTAVTVAAVGTVLADHVARAATANLDLWLEHILPTPRLTDIPGLDRHPALVACGPEMMRRLAVGPPPSGSGTNLNGNKRQPNVDDAATNNWITLAPQLLGPGALSGGAAPGSSTPSISFAHPPSSSSVSGNGSAMDVTVSSPTSAQFSAGAFDGDLASLYLQSLAHLVPTSAGGDGATISHETRARLLAPNHLLVLYHAVVAATSYAASTRPSTAVPPLDAFCAILAPHLTHVSLARSPFTALTSTPVLTMLMDHAMAHVDPWTGDLSPWTLASRFSSAAAGDHRHANAVTVAADALVRFGAVASDSDWYAFRWASLATVTGFARYVTVATFHAVNGNWTGVEAEAVATWMRAARHLYDRDSRRKFAPPDLPVWTVPGLDVASFVAQCKREMPPGGDYGALDREHAGDGSENDSDDDEATGNSERAIESRRAAQRARDAAMSPRHRILRDLPFVLPFEDRVALFREFVALDRSVTLGPNAEWRNLMVGERQRLEVRRDAVFEDGYAQITRLPTDSFKSRLAITFVSELGTTEAGIDGGGVFKEFFTLLARDAFDPNRGLFRATPHEQAMFPNPRAILDTRGLPPLGESSRAVVNAALAHQYDFVGRVVGKALYDGILVDVAFAPFFLNHWLGRRNLLEDLPSYDPQLARSLLSLSGFTSKDMHELGLTFSVDAEGGGIVDLIRDGRNVPVTSSNRIKYSYLLANFKLNAEIHRACSGFLSGMHQLIRPEWLRLFNQVELSNLVSGSQTSIDLDDMRLHATYGGEYNERHPVIGTFWAVVESFTDEDRRLLVRFITSCTRAPLLGFKELVPAMCIRPGGDDQEWLPTASTCVNLLKLPKYASADTLREKLLYSIRSGVGFELS